VVLTHLVVPGEEVDIRGPEGEIVYKGKGNFQIEGKDYYFDRVRVTLSSS
jgi:nitrate reductase (NAD(P)H)